MNPIDAVYKTGARNIIGRLIAENRNLRNARNQPKLQHVILTATYSFVELRRDLERIRRESSRRTRNLEVSLAKAEDQAKEFHRALLEREHS